MIDTPLAEEGAAPSLEAVAGASKSPVLDAARTPRPQAAALAATPHLMLSAPWLGQLG